MPITSTNQRRRPSFYSGFPPITKGIPLFSRYFLSLITLPSPGLAFQELPRSPCGCYVHDSAWLRRYTIFVQIAVVGVVFQQPKSTASRRGDYCL